MARYQIVQFGTDLQPEAVLAGTFPCDADPCAKHGTCHCTCPCGIGDDCDDCEGLSD